MKTKKRTKLIKSEVINLFKTTKETLRHYEKEGLISPEIDEKLYRYYDVDEMKRLRQVFLFKDLGFSIEEMKEIIDSKISDLDYKDLLIKQNRLLKNKIAYYQDIQYHITQLLEVLDEESFSLSFNIRTLDEKYYFVFNPFDSPFLDSMKAYYDQFKSIIESDYYSERALISIFPYSSMASFAKEDSNMCIELDKQSYYGELKNFECETLIMSKGLYLSVFYIFKDETFDELDQIKDKIDIYMKMNNLVVVEDKIIEIEHPELGISLSRDMTVYELQIRVERI